MKKTKIIFPLFALMIGFSSCSEEDENESECVNDDLCMEVQVTVCRDADGTETYMVGGENFDSFEAALEATQQCETTSKANLEKKLQAMVSEVRAL